MEKRKALSKGRLYKSKVDINKTLLDQLSSDSFNRISKIHHPNDLKKSSTPTPSRTPKPKNILNKRPSETPKLKIDDLEVKRRSVPNTQENLESYYSSYIKALTTKLEKHKKKNEELEEDLKQMELGFKLEENNLKKDLDRLNTELKKVKNDKFEQETSLMEENFRIRKDFEEYKAITSQLLTDIIPLIQIASEKDLSTEIEQLCNEVSRRIFEVSAKEHQENAAPRLTLKDTASFSNEVVVVNSPRAVLPSFFKEAIVLYSYVPEGIEELELKVGDRVTVFNSDESNAWWTGKIGENYGKFPRKCVMLD